VHGLHLAADVRYLSAAGLVAMLYDHALTFGDEVRLIWTAPSSFVKWVFLTNRYLTGVCLVGVANEMLGLNGRPYNDEACQILISTVSGYGIFSTLTITFLAYLRVFVLWDKSPQIGLWLSVAMMFSGFFTVICIVISIFLVQSFVKYDALSRMCIFTTTGPSLIGIWIAPLFFEILVIFLVSYNALSRPRGPERPLVGVLYRDSLMFFVAIALLRATNLVFSIITAPGLIAFPLFFIWAMTTVAINRMIIHARSSKDESESDADEENLRDATVSPIPRESVGSTHESYPTEPSSAIELHTLST